AKDDPDHAAAAVAAFRGITGVRNIVFEFDGPNLVTGLGYEVDGLARIAQAARSQGAGLKAANYSGGAALPSTYPVLARLSGVAASAATIPDAPVDQTVLLFLSKWTNYSYREKT